MSIPLSPEYRLSGLAQAGHALLARADAVLRANTAKVVREDAAMAAATIKRNARPVASRADAPSVSEDDLSVARAIVAAGEVRRARERQAAIDATWRRAIAANRTNRITR
jgi:hypothetical protein